MRHTKEQYERALEMFRAQGYGRVDEFQLDVGGSPVQYGKWVVDAPSAEALRVIANVAQAAVGHGGYLTMSVNPVGRCYLAVGVSYPMAADSSARGAAGS